MINVYVESNFVLELVLFQEQYESCEQIVALCEARKALLVIPAFSLIEPYQTLSRRARDRKQLSQQFSEELKQLERSEPYKSDLDVYKDLASLLTRIEETTTARFIEVHNKFLSIAEIVPLDTEILSSAVNFQAKYRFSSLPDALVFASIWQHLRANGASANCFLNRNRDDFDNPDIEDALEKENCKILFRFDTGYNYIKSQI